MHIESFLLLYFYQSKRQHFLMTLAHNLICSSSQLVKGAASSSSTGEHWGRVLKGSVGGSGSDALFWVSKRRQLVGCHQTALWKSGYNLSLYHVYSFVRHKAEIIVFGATEVQFKSHVQMKHRRSLKQARKLGVVTELHLNFNCHI